MSTYYDNNLERQLSSLFRAEAGQAHLPQGTWHELAQRMGEPDRSSFVRTLLEALGIPRWINPMTLKYVAPVFTTVIIVIIAILSFVLIDTDNELEEQGSATESTTQPIATSTIEQATAAIEPTAFLATAITESVLEYERFDVPGQVFRIHGDTIWAADSHIGMAQYTLDGELLQTVDLVSPGADGVYYDFVIADDVVWIIQGDNDGEGIGVVRAGTDGEYMDLVNYPRSNESKFIATDGNQIWMDNVEFTRRFVSGMPRVDGFEIDPIFHVRKVYAVDFAINSFWISLSGGDVLRFTPDGIVINSIATNDTAIAFDFDSEHLWLTLNDSIVKKFDLSGKEQATFEHENESLVAREIVFHDGFIWVMFDSDSGIEGQVVRLDLDAQLVSTHLDNLGVRDVQFTDEYGFFFSGYPSATQSGFIRMPLPE